MSDWTAELRQKAVDLYTEMEPTGDNTLECVKTVADALDKSANAVRMVLTKEGVYVKKATVTPSANKKASTRVSKQDALDELKSAISDVGQEPNEEIISKLTGKAAMYFVSVLRSVSEDQE